MIDKKRPEDPAAPRRSTHVPHEVVYAAVGASAQADLMRFPPEGSTPFASELRLGSGADRYLLASSRLMTWGAQRGAGIDVVEITAGDGAEYSGVIFDDGGTPQAARAPEAHFTPDGEPYLSVGCLATFRWADRHPDRRVRVVYTVDEPRRAGFAWGTTDDAGAIGEQAIIVEHREDDAVWATARGMLWPGAGLGGKLGIRFAIKEAERQLAALGPGKGAGSGSRAKGDSSAGPRD